MKSIENRISLCVTSLSLRESFWVPKRISAPTSPRRPDEAMSLCHVTHRLLSLHGRRCLDSHINLP